MKTVKINKQTTIAEAKKVIKDVCNGSEDVVVYYSGFEKDKKSCDETTEGNK